jgi:hypothetical protein
VGGSLRLHSRLWLGALVGYRHRWELGPVSSGVSGEFLRAGLSFQYQLMRELPEVECPQAEPEPPPPIRDPGPELRSCAELFGARSPFKFPGGASSPQVALTVARERARARIEALEPVKREPLELRERLFEVLLVHSTAEEPAPSPDTVVTDEHCQVLALDALALRAWARDSTDRRLGDLVNAVLDALEGRRPPLEEWAP